MSTKTSILIVDDDPNFRKTLSGILRARGYAPLAAATGKAALDRIEEEAPAVALIDLKLEDMSGLELMGKIKECCPGTECIVLTGYASQESAIDAVNLGAYSYEQKPYDMEQLLVTVRRAVEKREAEEALNLERQQLLSIFGGIDEPVYVSDPNTYEILYVNAVLREEFGDVVGQKCYQAFQGLKSPCPFCTNEHIFGENLGQSYIWEFQNRINHRWYRCIDKAIRWPDGRMVRYEMAVDITERKRAEERVQRLLDQQIAANQLALALGETRGLDEIYHTIYKHVHKLMDAEAFIVSFYDKEEKLIRAGYVVGEGTVLDTASFPPIPLEEVGHGTQSQVIHTGQPLYAPDWRKAMERTKTEYTFTENGTVSEGPPSPEEEDFSRSALYVPMKIEGETIGVMQAQSYQLDAYSQEDIDLLSALANVAAIAIQNARLYDETRSRAERLAVVNHIARAVGATLHLDELMETVYQEVTSVFQADAFFITLYDEEANELDFRIRVDEGVREPPQRHPLSVGLTSLVITEKKPLLVRDLERERDRLPLPEVWGTMKISASWLGVPMLIGEQLIGVICVQAYRPHAYGEEEQLLLSTIADQVAVAIEQARLYEAEREQRELAEALEAAAAAVSSTLEPDQVLDRILEEVERVVAGDAFNFMLIDDDTIRVVRWRGYESLGGADWIATLSIPIAEYPTLMKMVQSGKPLVVPDTAADPDWVRVGEEAWMCSYIGAPVQVGGVTVGLLNAGGTRPGQFGPADAHRLQAFADAAAAAIENARLFEQAQQEIAERKQAEEELQDTLEKLRKALGGIIQTVALTVEMKDPYTAGHQRRVANLARAIATEMGLSQEQIEGLRMAGGIHDLGKIAIPAEILSTPIRLNDFQWGMIKTHPQVGYDILRTIDFPWPVAQVVLQHHERLDGSGYPQGLLGEEIMLGARILAVADVVEAMSSHRPYRPALGVDKALEEISQNRGVLYDAEAVDACLKLFTEKGFEFE